MPRMSRGGAAARRRGGEEHEIESLRESPLLAELGPASTLRACFFSAAPPRRRERFLFLLGDGLMVR